MRASPSLTDARRVALEHVEQHQHLPDYIKDLAKREVIRSFHNLSQTLGALELVVGRTEHAVRDRQAKKRKRGKQ